MRSEVFKGFCFAALMLGLGSRAFAQAPDCYLQFTFTNDPTVTQPLPLYPVPGFAPGPTGATGNNNTAIGCVNWSMTYESQGFSVVSLTFQSANGATTPGTFGPFSGTTLSGSNPLTSTTGGTATFNGYVGWWNVALTATGTGTIRGSIIGYRPGFAPPSSAPPGSGCVGTVMTPCVVDGPTAAGSAPSNAPVQVSGFDGTNVQRIKTDTSGDSNVVGPDAAGSAPTQNPVSVAGFDGTNLQRLKTDTSGDAAVFQIGLGTFTAGQQAVTASAANLGNNTAKSVCVSPLIANTINVYIGPSSVTTGNGMELPPGVTKCWNVSNTNLLYVIASTTGATISWSLTN